MQTLREWFDGSGLSLTEFARRAALSRTTAYRILNGRTVPTIHALARIQKVAGDVELHISVPYLLSQHRFGDSSVS